MSDFEQDIKIDESALDIECLEQADLFMKYARELTDAERDADQSKTQLEIVKAEIDADIRANPNDYGFDKKPTESAITNTIVINPKYQNALDTYNENKYTASLLNKAVQAMNMRKSMLEVLAKLHGQKYFAGPKEPRNIIEERKERSKRVTEKLKERKKEKEHE